MPAELEGSIRVIAALQPIAAVRYGYGYGCRGRRNRASWTADATSSPSRR